MAAQVLLDYFCHERTAHARRECFDFIVREPHGAFDAGIEFTLGVVCNRLSEKACAVIGGVVAWRRVETDADETLDVHGPTRFLERFAQRRFDQRFVLLEMAGRLIEYELFARVFLDEQKAAVIFNDGGDGDVRVPIHNVQIE